MHYSHIHTSSHSSVFVIYFCCDADMYSLDWIIVYASFFITCRDKITSCDYIYHWNMYFLHSKHSRANYPTSNMSLMEVLFRHSSILSLQLNQCFNFLISSDLAKSLFSKVSLKRATYFHIFNHCIFYVRQRLINISSDFHRKMWDHAFLQRNLFSYLKLNREI